MAARDERIGGLVRFSVAESTWAAYGKVWKEWEQLGAWAGVPLSPLDGQELMFWWIYWTAEQGKSVAQIEKGMAALAFWFKLRGWEDFTKGFVVRQAIKGLKRGGVRSDSRRPLSVDTLRGLVRILGGICFSAYEIALFRAAFVLAFFGAFRVGELVSSSKLAPGGLQRTEVEFGAGRVDIWLRRSKTDQHGKGRRVMLYAIDIEAICPVVAVQLFLAMRPNIGGPLLIHADGSPLTRFQFVRLFRLGLEKVGLAPMEYGSHSFRIGAATEAARLGLGDTAVQRIGRWESRRFRSYIRLARLQ